MQNHIHWPNRSSYRSTSQKNNSNHKGKIMKVNYDKCLETILHHEGGYVNHPKDPGVETNLGVTKKVYQEHGGTKDMKDLLVEDVTRYIKKVIGIK